MSDTRLRKETIRRLQNMRRANEAIGACVEILNEHGANSGSIPGGPRVFIRLDPSQEAGLIFAIEICQKKVQNEFDDYFEELGVNWLDEFSPKLNRRAEAADELQNGEITFAEFEKRAS